MRASRVTTHSTPFSWLMINVWLKANKTSYIDSSWMFQFEALALWYGCRGVGWPVMLILADHLEVPSSTACLAVFRWLLTSSLETWNISWITSNTSGRFFSLIFMRSFIAMMIFWVLSSAPCLELFSTAPETNQVCLDPIVCNQSTCVYWMGFFFFLS